MSEYQRSEQHAKTPRRGVTSSRERETRDEERGEHDEHCRGVRPEIQKTKQRRPAAEDGKLQVRKARAREHRKRRAIGWVEASELPGLRIARERLRRERLTVRAHRDERRQRQQRDTERGTQEYEHAAPQRPRRG